MLLVFTGVSGWVVPVAALLATAAGSAGEPPLASFSDAAAAADFSEDLEERNMGKKWLVFFDSFWGVAGEGVAVVVVGLTGIVVVDVGEVGEWVVDREEEEELPCCCGAVEAAGTGLDSGDVAGVASAEPDGLVVVVVGSVRPFDLEGAIFSESASWHSSSRCWSLTVAQSGTSELSEELASTLLLLLLLLLLVIALCW